MSHWFSWLDHKLWLKEARRFLDRAQNLSSNFLNFCLTFKWFPVTHSIFAIFGRIWKNSENRMHWLCVGYSLRGLPVSHALTPLSNFRWWLPLRVESLRTARRRASRARIPRRSRHKVPSSWLTWTRCLVCHPLHFLNRRSFGSLSGFCELLLLSKSQLTNQRTKSLQILMFSVPGAIINVARNFEKSHF